MSEDVKAEYTSSLADLTFNSKPLINMLTMLADENVSHAKEIVEVIETHLSKVQTDVKLPILYLIDCIIKNVGTTYTELFSQNIVSTFCNVFKMVDEKTRGEMFKLRQTWNDVFPQKKLYAIDVQIRLLDPAWPVTAKPSPSSIHFNPKFLKTTTPTEVKTMAPIIPVSTSGNIDPETYNMQQKLIMKQKELIELQQKKLELELLQNQMKLQEKIKNNPGMPIPPSQNILLKPEVAKQIISGSMQQQTDSKRSQMASVMGQRLLNNSSSGPRIAPANSALIAASRKPIRDPRLLRQLQMQQQKQTNSSSNVQLESKTAIDSNNKFVNNKMSVRDNRSEPRLVNNKDSILSQNKVDTKPKSSSRTSNTTQKPFKSSRGTTGKISSSDSETKSVSSKGSTSSLDSPNKNKSDKSDSNKLPKSPTKHKKKESPTKSDKKSSKELKRDRDSGSSKFHKSDSITSPTTFKGIKSSSKNRNYVRRNRSSASPEPTKDVDLRLAGPPEKQPRLQSDPVEIQSPLNSVLLSPNKDVDLRQIPAPVPSKKRLSTESPEHHSSKKSKSEMFDALFGDEDTDLRQLPIVNTDRPKTPPPPIISSIDENDDNEIESVKTLNNLDAVRAKLAIATNKDKVLSKSFHKKSVENRKVDEDMRTTSDILKKIIISPAEEQCIKEGNLSTEQGQQLMNKIIAQIEKRKLNEAKQKDHEESFGNITLQPISDDELKSDSSEDENDRFPRSPKNYGDRDDRDDRDERISSKDERLPDKDERIPQPHNIQNDETYHKFGRDIRDQRRLGPSWRGNRRRHWDAPPIGPPIRPGLRPRLPPQMAGNWRAMGPSNFRPPHSDFQSQSDINNLPIINLDDDGIKSPEPENIAIEATNQDDIKTICIDGVPRDIRYYDDTAVIFMNWDDPKEISFQDGSRRITFDDRDTYILEFNAPYTDVIVNGTIHKVKFVGPSREICIDDKYYECYFGGPGINIDLDGKTTFVKLEGPPPQVKIGNVRRTDLVAGKVNLIIDAKSIVPVYLDGKVQKFSVNGDTHTLKFVDALNSVLINDFEFKVEFGGLPRPITLNGRKYFIRFTVVPKGIKPGNVYIKDLDGCTNPPSPKVDENSQDSMPTINSNEPALPIITRRRNINTSEESPENSNSPNFFQNLLQQQTLNNLDVLSSVISSSAVPANNAAGYKVESILPNTENPSSQQDIISNPLQKLPSSLNINEIFQKLVATGIVTANTSTILSKTEPESLAITTTTVSNNNNVPVKRVNEPVVVTSNKVSHRKNSLENLRLLSFERPETLKVRQSLLYDILYSGMQCSGCGMRFPPEQSTQYSQHLDWHYRQNRKNKKNIRVAASRRWYYSLADWKNYEELEDLEEREKNYFDQQQQADGGSEELEEEIVIPSVPANPNTQVSTCSVCLDRFDQFFNEEKEEWHLKNAICIDDKIYHPVCYDDYLASLLDNTLDETKTSEETTEQKQEDSEIPGLEIILDDEEEEELRRLEDTENGEQVIIEESDESKPPTEENTQVDETEEAEYEEDDDDVIINEVIPDRIILDDDDDNEHEEYVPMMPKFRRVISDDNFMDVEDSVILGNIGAVRIKTEPIDNDDSRIENGNDSMNDETAISDMPEAVREKNDELEEESAETSIPVLTQPVLVSSMDGNTELDPGITTSSGISNKIKINISKALPIVPAKDNKDTEESESVSSELQLYPSQPLPPGEEPVQLNLKPGLQGLNLKKMPPVEKGSELTGMCSIM